MPTAAASPPPPVNGHRCTATGSPLHRPSRLTSKTASSQLPIPSSGGLQLQRPIYLRTSGLRSPPRPVLSFRGDLPQPSLLNHQRRAVLVGLAKAIKTPGWLPALGSFSLGFHPLHLARILGSFADHRVAVAFFAYALRNRSACTARACCSVVRLLLTEDLGGDGSRSLKPLAEEILSCVIRRMYSPRGLPLVDLALEDDAFGSSEYATLNLFLRAFVKCDMVLEAMEVLGKIRNKGLQPSQGALSSLTKLLFQKCQLRSIWKLFKELMREGPWPSVRCFNDMILGFCLRGDVRIAENLLKIMHKFHRQPDVCSFNIVIKAHCMYGRSSNAFGLLRMMHEEGCSPSVVTFNILINVLCREGRMGDAQRLFDEIPKQGAGLNRITFNVLMDGYVKAGQVDRAFSVYEEMMAKGLSPDCYTFNILTAGDLKFRREGERVMNRVLNVENFSMNSALDIVISRCCWEGQLSKARELLDSALEEGIMPTIVAFNAVLAAYSKAGLEEEAFEFYHLMRKFGLAASASTCNSLVMCLCDQGRMNEARELLDKWWKGDGDADGAGRVWDSMKSYGILPDVIAFSAYINGLCISGSMDKAYEAFLEMHQRQLVPNNFVYNSLMNGLKMKENGLTPDVFTKNIIIKGLCGEKIMDKANDVYMSMYSCGLKPDVVTYNTLVGAYCKERDLRSALNIITKMTLEGCDPDITTYNIWIHGLSTACKMNQALRVIDDIVSKGVLPNTVTYNTLMNGICTEVWHCKIIQDRVLIMTGKLIKMAFFPNVVTVNILLSHLCRQGLAERAVLWEQRLSQVPFPFDITTCNILNWARRCIEHAETTRPDQQISLFLEALMYIALDSICRNRSSHYRPVVVTTILDHCSGEPPQMVQI
ncbi:unnamed protein product [Spirodela intermedia]|uniref:Uncharacterized protein n=1 Tax=Spirodela intermedia TaxID=51605 RepID=A0A7I8JJK6_SPIIN|nr:unnamed protein product [Spirodela intermedia]CAA6669763.1 unnamed protein product [Spirodela intermedia]